MKKIAVFASGYGSNFEAIVRASKNRILEGEISLLVCDNPNANAINIAKKENIDIFTFDPKEYDSKSDYESEILNKLLDYNIELIALGGYMRLIGPKLLNDYKNKIVNIHPSLLPAFKGKNAIEKALDYGVKVIGITIHYVDEGMDTGKIIYQDCFKLEGNASSI